MSGVTDQGSAANHKGQEEEKVSHAVVLQEEEGQPRKYDLIVAFLIISLLLTLHILVFIQLQFCRELRFACIFAIFVCSSKPHSPWSV